MLSSIVGRIQRRLGLLASRRRAQCYLVPDDVMDGHIAVLAIEGEETKRFIVELHCLTDPPFMELLDRAREEFGFGQKGALAVPCRPHELQKILDDRKVVIDK